MALSRLELLTCVDIRCTETGVGSVLILRLRQNRVPAPTLNRSHGAGRHRAGGTRSWCGWSSGDRRRRGRAWVAGDAGVQGSGASVQ